MKSFNPLLKILEIAKDKEVPRPVIIKDLKAIIKYLQQLKEKQKKYFGLEATSMVLIDEIL